MSRGVALVEEAIQYVEGGGRPGFTPIPADPKLLAALTFPGGKPLPASLRRWLAFDAAWLGWFDDPRAPVFKPRRLHEVVETQVGGWGDAFVGISEKLLSGDCYFFEDTAGFEAGDCLYVGAADALGEYPVLHFDTDDSPEVGLMAPGFDVYVAWQFGIITVKNAEDASTLFKDERFAESMREQAKLNVGGRKRMIDPGQFA